jgi:geranylgeranyl diphosphate synthase type I
MASTLQKLSEILLPEIDSQLHRSLSRLDEPGFEGLYRILAYQLGWDGAGAGKKAKGKRIRPLLVLLTTGAAGGAWQKALPLAASVELLHNFSLIHDDIEDNSPMRRGRATIWEKWGVPQAINSGDTMFTLAFLAINDFNTNQDDQLMTLQASLILEETSLRLTQGQYQDISYENRNDLTEEDYWSMIMGKTASLIGACSEMGALAAGVDFDIQKHYRGFGIALGTAFQVQDDLLGIWGDANITGKSVDSDLVSGKKSLPVIYGLQNGGDFSKRWLSGPISPQETSEIALMLEREGALDYTQQRANFFTQQALNELEKAKPRGEFGESLFELTDKLLNRQK